jgi:hypothetical protein
LIHGQLAQRFKADDDTLSAIDLYLDRTTGTDSPVTLHWWIYPDSDATVFSDPFDDYSFLNEVTNNNMGVSNGWLLPARISSQDVYRDLGAESHAQSPHNKYIGVKCYKSNDASTNWFNRDVRIYEIEGYLACDNTNRTLWCYVHSANTGDYSKIVASTSAILTTNPQLVNFYFNPSNQPIVYSGQEFFVSWHVDDLTDDIWMYGSVYANTWDLNVYQSVDDSSWAIVSNRGYGRRDATRTRIYGTQYTQKGNIESVSNIITTQYMTLSGTTVSGENVKLSGSQDNGTTWASITNGTQHDFGSEDDYATVMYIISTSKFHDNLLTPGAIDLATLTVKDAKNTVGEPANDPVEFSDDITITKNDLPYPSGWIGYQSYASPKLRLTEDSLYWMVISANSADDGSPAKWSIFYDSGNLAITSGMTKVLLKGTPKWSGTVNFDDGDKHKCPSGAITFKLGYKDVSLRATASNDLSIGLYGRHYRQITDSTINTEELAQERANFEVSGMHLLKKKGNMVINGRTDMETYYRFSSNLTNFGINELWDIVSYTQRITSEEGFTTEIYYGKQPYDFIKEIEDLKNEAYANQR